MTRSFSASLPWYDDESTSRPLDELWCAMAYYLRANGVDKIPHELRRNCDVKTLWQSAQLILGQCCGPDLFTAEGASLRVIARPVFANLDCSPGSYYSHIAGRTNLAGKSARIAVNSLSSRSGYMALIEWMHANSVSVSTVQISGSHKNSLAMVVNDQADLIAIDAHTLNQCNLSLDVPIVGRSSEGLAPPFVCHRDCGINTDLLYDALKYAIGQNGEAAGIVDIVRCHREDYRSPGADTFAAG